MSKVQSYGLSVDGTAVQPGSMETAPGTPVRIVRDEPGNAGEGDGPPEHSLLSRPVPQGRRSLFRR